jgi:hypothetical protein
MNTLLIVTGILFGLQAVGAGLSASAIDPGRPNNQRCYSREMTTSFSEVDDDRICNAVERELNLACDQPPQDNRRRFIGLKEPDWEVLDTAKNLPLVKAAFLASWDSAYRDGVWADTGSTIERLATDHVLRLSRAVADLDNMDGPDLIYMLENVSPQYQLVSGANQPRFFIAAKTGNEPSHDFEYGKGDYGDLWEYEGRWIVVRFNQEKFQVRLVIRPTVAPAGLAHICNIQKRP